MRITLSFFSLLGQPGATLLIFGLSQPRCAVRGEAPLRKGDTGAGTNYSVSAWPRPARPRPPTPAAWIGLRRPFFVSSRGRAHCLVITAAFYFWRPARWRRWRRGGQRRGAGRKRRGTRKEEEEGERGRKWTRRWRWASFLPGNRAPAGETGSEGGGSSETAPESRDHPKEGSTWPSLAEGCGLKWAT